MGDLVKTSGLVDQHGNPIASVKVSTLGGEIAGADPSDNRSPFRMFADADAPTPWMLATVLREAELGNSWRLQELAETMEERDPHYAGVISTRKRTVTQVPMRVEAASEDAEHKAHAEFVEEWLKDGVLGDAAKFNMLDAIAKGFSVLEIVWGNGEAGIVPQRLVYRPQRWFEIDRLDGEGVLLRKGGGLVPLAPWKFVVHRHAAKSGLLLRAGLVRLACWSWMFKTFTLRDWGLFAQNYGAPIRLGRYGPESSVADRQVLWRAVNGIAGDCAAIIPKSMELEFVSPANTAAAADLFERRCDWLDKQVSKAVLGQTATTDANPGSHAAGQTHRLVQEDIERADCGMLAETITRQLVQPIIAFNFPGFAGPFPRVLIGHPDDVPLAERITAMQWLGPQGLTVGVTEWRDLLGFDEPEDGEPVVGGVAAPVLPTVPGTEPKKQAEPGDANPDQAGGKQDMANGEAAGGKTGAQQAGDDPAQGRTAAHSMVGALLARHVRSVSPEIMASLTDRLAEDARGALGGLTEQVRHVVETATDLRDLSRRLEGLQLDDRAFATAMQRGLAIAHLAGQAELLDDIGRG